MKDKIEFVRSKIAKGELDDGITSLELLIQEINDYEFTNTFIVLSSRFYQEKKKHSLGLIKDFEPERNKTIHSILELLTYIDEKFKTSGALTSSENQTNPKNVDIFRFESKINNIETNISLDNLNALEEFIDFRTKVYDSIFGKYEEMKKTSIELRLSENLILFDRILFGKNLSPIDKKDIQEIKQIDSFKIEKSIIVRGITLSLLNLFNIEKFKILLDYLNQFEEDVWHDALVGLVLVLSKYDKVIEAYPNTINRLRKLKKIPEVQNAISYILDNIAPRDISKPSKEVIENEYFSERPSFWFLRVAPNNPIIEKTISVSNFSGTHLKLTYYKSTNYGARCN